MSKFYYHDEDGVPRWHEEPQGAPRTPGWPQRSDGAAVHPDQIPEARDHARRSGVPTEFAPTGEPILTSARHQARYLRSVGLHNKDGVFS